MKCSIESRLQAIIHENIHIGYHIIITGTITNITTTVINNYEKILYIHTYTLQVSDYITAQP